MISDSDLKKISDYLEKSKKPLFLFDDDNDGLCSFLLLRGFTKKGDGMPIKTSPELNSSMVGIVRRYGPDYVFVLDKPLVSQEFVDKVIVPVVWIDHHEPIKRDGVRYFNPKLDGSEDHSSTTYWCYKAVGGKLWIAVIGAVSDWTIPDYFNRFKDEYPDLVSEKITPTELLYNSKLGRLCRIFSFLNKGDHKWLKEVMGLLLNIGSPYDILEGKTVEGKIILGRAEKIEKKYNALLDDALKSEKDGKLIIYTYASADTSFTSDLSNELLYRNSGYFIIVARQKDDKIYMSLRSDVFPVRSILESALKEVKGYGGGHFYACGAGINEDDFSRFAEIIKKEVNR